MTSAPLDDGRSTRSIATCKRSVDKELVIQDLACTEISLLAFKESALMGLNKPDSAASAPVGAIWVEADGVVHCYLCERLSPSY